MSGAPESSDDDAEQPASEKPLDFGDPLAGAGLEDELDESDPDAKEPAHGAFGSDSDWDLQEIVLEPEGDVASLLDVGGLVPSLPVLAPEELDMRDAPSNASVVSDVPASAFLQGDWSMFADEIGPDELGDDSAPGAAIPYDVLESFDELGDGGEDGQQRARESWSIELGIFEQDDHELALSAAPWHAARLGSSDIHALLLTEGQVIAAGEELVSVPRDVLAGAARGVHIGAKPPHPLVAVVPWLDAQLLCASAVGSLYRYSTARGFELESELHRRLGVPLDAPIGWRLAAYRFGPGRTGAAVLCSNGRVLLSDSDGRLRSQLGRASALGAGSPLTLIHPHDGSLGLRRLEDSTGRWRESTLTLNPGMRIDAETELCCHGELVAIAHPESGVWVSLDSGTGFQRVAGSGNVTAIHFGELEGRPMLFLASATAAPAVRVMLCDPSSLELECIAELEPGELSREPNANLAAPTATNPVEPQGALSGGDFTRGEERDEWTARALLWDARSRVLWVGGSLGLIRLSRR